MSLFPGKKQGFTLIEIILVIAIISFLMAWILPQIAPLLEQSKLVQKQGLIEQTLFDQKTKAISGFTETPKEITEKQAGFLAYGLRISAGVTGGIYPIKAAFKKNSSDTEEPENNSTNILASSSYGEQANNSPAVAVVENLTLNGTPIESIDILYPPSSNSTILKTSPAFPSPPNAIITFTLKSNRYPKNRINATIIPSTATFTSHFQPS